MKFTSINRLIAYLTDIRDEHSLDLPVRFFIDGGSRIELDKITLKVVTTQNYTEGFPNGAKSELIISLS